MPSFDPIRPGDRDFFVFDFTSDLASNASSIVNVTWTCVISIYSDVVDPTPGARLLGSVSHDSYKTSALIGNMLNGVVYTLTASITSSDGRTLSQSADVECILYPITEDTDLDTVSIDEFRATFPAFADKTKYPDVTVSFWLDQAVLAMDQDRWGQFYDQGVRLYTAHMLAVNLQSSLGGSPIGSGVISSKSVGGVSIGYDTQFGAEKDAGAWALTIWGNQFFRLQLLAGSAPIQL